MASTSKKPGSGGSRSQSKFDRRTARNRKIIFLMAGLMFLSVVGAALSGLIGGGAANQAPEIDDQGLEDDPAAAPEEPQEPEETVGPCGETPDDVPAVAAEIYDEPFPLTIDPDAPHMATLSTTCGDIVVELAAEDAPETVNSFVNLAEDGYYDGVIFHRITDQPQVIQGGDPAGTGCGREDCSTAAADEPSFPGFQLEDELAGAEEMAERMREVFVAELRAELEEFAEAGIEPEDLGLPAEPTDEDLRALVPGGYERGTVAMANSGPDTVGSQFFIVWDDTPLPPLYTILGTVVDGMDVVDDIAASPTQVAGDTPERPFEPVVIRGVEVEVG